MPPNRNFGKKIVKDRELVLRKTNPHSDLHKIPGLKAVDIDESYVYMLFLCGKMVPLNICSVKGTN